MKWQQQLEDLWANLLALGARRLATLGGVAAATMLLVGSVGYYSSRAENEALYVGLSAADVSRMGAALQSAGISFDVSSDGTKVLVRRVQAPAARMLLAEKGLPSGSTAGYELFDKLGPLGLTSFMQDVMRTRALEGELARTIQTVKGVKSARVHIVYPDNSAFRRGRQPASASVVVRMEGLREPSSALVIRHLVSAAVPGLAPEQVSVMSTDGFVLAAIGDTSGAASAKLMDLERNVANQLQDNTRKSPCSAEPSDRDTFSQGRTMTNRLSRVCGLLLLFAADSGSASCADLTAAISHARTLMMVQDQIVLGSGVALDAVPELRRRLAAEIVLAPSTAWKEQQNGRALVVYLLNGGSAHPIQTLIEKKTEFGELRDVILALVALAERRKNASELLTNIDASSLDPAIAGQFALTQAISVSAAPEKSMAYLALAKLLSPGGLVEESAMRREIQLHLSAGRKLQGAQAATRYLWRFGASVYANDVLLFLSGSALSDLAATSDSRLVVSNLMRQVPQKSRVDFLLSISRSGILRGKMEIAHFAAASALPLAEPDSAESTRAEIYIAIGDVFLRGEKNGTERIGNVKLARLRMEEVALLDATNIAIERISAPLMAWTATEAETTLATHAARSAIDAADAVLERVQP